MHDDHAIPKPTDAVAQGQDKAKAAPRRLLSSDLFAGAREIVIDHDGRLYQLRITQNGKLILTA
jgi:hemin uptake protein HemP